MKLRFTIRDLLWLTVVVGISMGWWLDHERNKPHWPIGDKNMGYTPFKPPYNADVPTDSEMHSYPFVEVPSAGPSSH
jgi:hypothetical protein